MDIKNTISQTGAAKILGVSNSRITTMIGAGQLDVGLTFDNKRLVTMSSLNKLKKKREAKK